MEEEFHAQQQGEDHSRRGLYDVTRSMREQSSSISRLVYACRLSEERGVPDIGNLTEQWVNDCAEKGTGILLISGSYSIHILEGSSKYLYEHINWVRATMLAKITPLLNVNIIGFSEQNPGRFYQFWASRAIGVQTTGEEYDEKANVEELSWTVYNNLCQMGPKLAQVLGTNRQPNSNALAAALKSTSRELIPSTELLVFLAGSRFTSIEEYISMYNEPMDIVLDNELVWPCPPELSF